MADIYLFILILICVGLLGWGLIRLERVYQYPFIMGGIFASFILPQAISLFNNPGPVSQEALERVLLMSCLCAAMCWVGYQLPVNRQFLKSLDIAVDSQKFLYGGIFLIIIAGAASFQISRLPEEYRLTTQWTGIITIYAFFRALDIPGFAIILSSTLQRPTIAKIILSVIASSNQLYLIVSDGRREVTANFILTIGIALFFCRRLLPPRSLVIATLVAAAIAIPFAGVYRGIARSGNWHELAEVKPLEAFQELVEEGDILELRNAAMLMDAAVKTGEYGLGTDYWNAIVFGFIPAQIVGRTFKSDLQLQLYAYDLKSLYNYSIPTGSTNTGIGDSFVQFDYFGCLFFLFVAYLFKNLWASSIDKNGDQNRITSQVFYISLVAPAMISVTHGTQRFFPDVLFRLIFVGGIIVFYARKKPLRLS